MRHRRSALGLLSDAFFYGYTGLRVVAGAAGAASGRAELVGLALILARTRSKLRR